MMLALLAVDGARSACFDGFLWGLVGNLVVFMGIFVGHVIFFGLNFGYVRGIC